MSYGPNDQILAISGEVTQVNQWGILVQNTWYNYSKRKEIVVDKHAEVGDRVILEVEGKWIVSMHHDPSSPRNAARPTAPAGGGVLPDQREGAYDGPSSNGSVSRPSPAVQVRAIAIQAAAIFLATKKKPDGQEASSNDVLAVAKKFATWIEHGEPD